VVRDIAVPNDTVCDIVEVAVPQKGCFGIWISGPQWASFRSDVIGRNCRRLPRMGK